MITCALIVLACCSQPLVIERHVASVARMAQVVARDIHRDAVEPCAHRRLAAESRERLDRRGKGLLQQILDVGVSPGCDGASLVSTMITRGSAAAIAAATVTAAPSTGPTHCLVTPCTVRRSGVLCQRPRAITTCVRFLQPIAR